MANKKVVFLADCLITQKAGIHFYTHQLIERVISQYPDNQYYIVLPYPYKKLKAKEVLVPIKRYLPGHYRLRYFWDIPKVVNDIKPDIVIETAHFGPFRLDKDILKVTVIHDLTPVMYPEWHDKLSHIMHKILLPGILENADKILANSINTSKDILAYKNNLDSKKILLVYPKFKKPEARIVNQYKSYISGDYFLTVGTIEPRKNYITLIKAFEIFCQTNDNIFLRIVGYTGWKSKGLLEYIDASEYSDRIIIEGYMDDERLNLLYSQATAFVFPSLYEGFGLPLLEAMSFSLPIICSRIPTSVEVCEDSALYFEPQDISLLSKHMLSIVNDEVIQTTMRTKSLTRFNAFNAIPLELDELFL